MLITTKTSLITLYGKIFQHKIRTYHNEINILLTDLLTDKKSLKMRIKEIMEEKLVKGIGDISYLEIVDESNRHIGHAGYKDGGESHFKIVISSNMLKGQNRVKAHKVIHHILKSEISKIHALQIEIR